MPTIPAVPKRASTWLSSFEQKRAVSRQAGSCNPCRIAAADAAMILPAPLEERNAAIAEIARALALEVAT
ncbi:MAG: hypothetical protein QHC90_26695 [Shinella sp.]|nr:hypothetical protein [Shinella sp.]